MKTINKLLSILVVLTLVLSLGASAFAATITIKDDDANSTYTAYELLHAKYDAATGLYQYTLNETFNAAVQAGLKAVENDLTVNADNESKVVDAISKLQGDDVRKFADAAFAVINGSEEMKAAAKQADRDNSKQFSNMEGYYLIAETVNNEEDGAVTSLVMLGTYGNESKIVTTKEDHPSSGKKVKEHNDTTGLDSEGWQDGADYDIGDDVPYQLSGTINSTNYSEYETYYLQFVDDMSAGLGAPENVSIYWVAPGGNGAHNDVTSSFAQALSDSSSSYAGGHVYTWTCENIKELGIPAGATVYVEYTAKLLEGAVIGDAGNPNDSHIVYSNNPYSNGHGETKDDKVTVFTFELDVTKKDGADNTLEGAGFTLLKKVPGPVPGDATSVEYDNLKTAAVGNYYVSGENVYQVVKAQIEGGPKFVFKGLDSGEYLLVETTVPEHFNKAADIEITIEATYDTNSDDPKLTNLKVTPAESFTVEMKGEVPSGIISGDVINLTGAELPETGGIGTTIFYTLGAVLVIGAVIVLVTKKRMGGAAK